MPSPLSYTWEGDCFRPLRHCQKECDRRYVIGQRYRLDEIQERDMVKHARQFAFIADAWENLPERYANEPWAQSAEHLRKFALIKTGCCNTETFACNSRAEAMRWAAQLRSDNEYAIVTIQGTTIYRFTAMSQSVRAMGAAQFYESRKKVMAFVAELIGTDAETLSRQGAAA
jgi:hypothetical protein